MLHLHINGGFSPISITHKYGKYHCTGEDI